MLESDYVLFRGDFRLKIPFKEMKSVAARGVWLEIESAEGTLALELGKAAEKWAHKILHPPSRLDKLGIKPGMVVSIIGITDDAFVQEVAACGADVRLRLAADCDIVVYGAEKKAALGRLEALGKSLKPTSAIWVVYPKGIREITENDVLTAIRAAQWVDVKVASFSPTHTALKSVCRRGHAFSLRAGLNRRT